jgi:hypothetical protein
LDIGGYTTAGFSSGTEAFASDIEREGVTVKKEKKKKKVKNKELLHHREKVHPEKIKGKFYTKTRLVYYVALWNQVPIDQSILLIDVCCLL